MSLSSHASPEPSVRTVPVAFLDTVRRQPDATAIRWSEGEGFGSWTWREYADKAARIAAGLRELGVKRGDRIILLMRNRPEFHIADVGALLAGATPVSIYNSSSPEQIAYLAGHCEAVAAVVEDGVFLSRVQEARASLPQLRHVLRVGGSGAVPSGVRELSELLAASPLDLEEAARSVQPGDLATLIYTSGTTGQPKGVMLTHRNIASELEALFHYLGRNGAGKRVVSFLPMAHIAERIVTHYLHTAWGSEATCCPDAAQLTTYLVGVRPTFMFGPPRVWEKLHAGVRAVVGVDPAKAEGFEKALTVGRKASDARALGVPLPAELQQAWETVDAAAFAPLRKKLGLDALEFAFSGAAPIPPEVIQFFRNIGLPMSELFGMSEGTGAMSWDPHRVKVGTVGRPVPGVEMRRLEDGEIVFRGGIVFPGYLNDSERTAEALDSDGWLHTGDIGEIDAEGYLKIVDRKKELIITAGGKNVSPANLESMLKTLPLVGQAVAVGDRRPYLVAVLQLNPEVAPGWAKARGLAATDLRTLAEEPVVQQELTRGWRS
ncbi:AMP-dependent synthetase/ligase [Archangium lansingense]|uniref:AMP-dependent synthetase/ligase n=1 Tax=Archangium lansingense TaxID=2995310 RepID=A0ABT4ALB6_9BACT|nr:AMP-dependent synthetase/ligase [Archangium lansinium]MCY1082361.1 AMP-dependent synthetase/ligase [Archangium lansinium]